MICSSPANANVVEVTAPGRIVYIAGQLGVDRDGQVVGDIRAQAVQTFENLKTALAAVGADFGHVLKFNNYLVDSAHMPTFREVRDKNLNMAAPPASVGTTPKDVIYHRGTMSLYHYRPMASEIYRIPLLLVMATTNKAYIFDLAPGQSLVEP